MLAAFNSPDSMFNLISGKIAIYVSMDVLMECVAVLIYVTAVFMLPLGSSQNKGTQGQPKERNRPPVGQV